MIKKIVRLTRLKQEAQLLQRDRATLLLQTLICVLVARPRRCLTLWNPVP